MAKITQLSHPTPRPEVVSISIIFAGALDLPDKLLA